LEQCTLYEYSPTDLLDPSVHRFRLLLTELFKDVSKPPSKTEINNFIKKIESSNVSKDPYVQDLVKDVSGQILEGLEGEAWNRWGRHFIPSLCRAHLLQQCNNFKDPGVQHYGGKLFRTIRESAEELFVKLPPPIATKKKEVKTYSPVTNTYTTTTTNYQPASMHNYYDISGGCIGSEGNVLMQDNSFRKVKDIRKGDYVKLPNGESAQVICVTRTTLNPRDKAPLVLLQTGLVITPWHPVLLNNNWRFPCQIGELWNTSVSSHDVYNFVLDKGHIMTVNGIDCVTLGHGFTDEVVKHNYFGTEEVINDLKSMSGWETGFIDLNNITTRRDPESRLVTGYLIN